MSLIVNSIVLNTWLLFFLDSTFQEAITGIPRGNYGDVVCLLLTVVFGSDLCGIQVVSLDKSVTTLGIHMFSRTVVIAYVFPRIAWL